VSKDNTQQPKRKNIVRRFFSVLGPGLITGAADDDPSGVATYTIAGAQLGTSLLWTAFITWPLMGCVQFMCARIGMITGRPILPRSSRHVPPELYHRRKATRWWPIERANTRASTPGA
jgi:Mn2+/Fe2+ NRAMP family transporter